MIHKLPDLPYSYDALEPQLDVRTMEIHHTKHHAGYIKKLNDALEKAGSMSEKPLKEILTTLSAFPSEVKTTIRNNAGGHFNHSLFWTILSPEKSEPEGEFLEAINNFFGDLEKFKEEFSNSAATCFGSGWAWLSAKKDGSLVVSSTPNQDNPLMEDNTLTPILGLDVWEHAYYLRYQNRRPDYISAFWHIVNWPEVAKNYSSAING